MPPKRKRRASLTSKGLAPGERLKRSTLPGNNSSHWGWVGTEVVDPLNITPEYLLMACGLSERNSHPFCSNKYSLPNQTKSQAFRPPTVDKELEDEIIIISDNEQAECTRKGCRTNPNCLNYLGQDQWEDEDEAVETFIRAVNSSDNPILNGREPGLPVGLKNLGATCYANASLQVWFRDLTFRAGVYTCQPTEGSKDVFEDSPIFQLQVTFTALQEGTQSVYNPIKLVESLQLRTTEQQDAQEFSKLFMSHLDAEFKKQTIPTVKSLITNQFQGRQIYGTICNHCQYRSERVSDFLEIEISFMNNSKLEDRIAALLQPETLSGDNKYFCFQCNSLQDATRYTELQELPPVLHFSLLRFVYDISTMERKKLKHAISFPTKLNMGPFLGSFDKKTSVSHDDSIYELHGILLHKGSSAYHGHYEAQVYDAGNDSWFQFNDESVTKLESLDEKQRTKISVIEIEDDSDEQPHSSQIRKYRTKARKRCRVDDSDDASSGVPETLNPRNSKDILSKDAYMLIYTRKGSSEFPSGHLHHSLSTDHNSINSIPVPPPRALQVVRSLNAAHDEACETFDKNQELIKAQFQQRRQEVMDIYRSWNVQSVHESSVIVSQQALKIWLSQHKDESGLVIVNHKTPEPSDEPPSRRSLQLDDIICRHQRLDPKKAGDIKRISKRAYTQIVNATGYVCEPSLTSDDVCSSCVEANFKERLYQIEHPRLVHQFDQIAETITDCKGYWISKLWLKDWKLMKPKMHVISEGDPAPDSPEYEAHVQCEHGGLSINAATRQRISIEATEFLKKLYPSWNPLSTDVEPCPVCDTVTQISKEGKREMRKKAEDEKAKLKHMYECALTDVITPLNNEPGALISADFLITWKQWLDRPADAPRPTSIDNTSFICEHDLLNLDPNSPTDYNSSFTLIKRSDWDILETIYPGGPLISVTECLKDTNTQVRLVHDITVCVDCRLKRKSDWITTEIIVNIPGTKSTSEINSKDDAKVRNPFTYASKTGGRQSKRLRQMKELRGKRRLIVSKLTTVKEVKVMLQQELDIPTICQKLFYNGQELDDSAATIDSLHIYSNDVLDLQEENEIITISSDTEETMPKGEERGFGGTLLGGVVDQPQEFNDMRPVSNEKACSACTFSNDIHALNCMICDTPFI